MEFDIKEAGAVSEETELNNIEKAAVSKTVRSGIRMSTFQIFLTVCIGLALAGGSFAW